MTPQSMMAVVTTGNGGYEKLEYREILIPSVLGPNEALLRVLAAGVNNTEINTRLGWYSSSVTTDTQTTADDNTSTTKEKKPDDGGWNGATPFPLIQGTDCCGRVVQVGADVDPSIVGKRCLVRPCMRPKGYDVMDNTWMASDFDGAFAEYVKVPASEVFPVDCDWSDEELATIPCAYGTAENMLHRVNLKTGEAVFISGASGGVGSATIQLAKRRGATVIAMTSLGKAKRLMEIGADRVVGRGDDLVKVLEAESVDVVVDNVAGAGFPQMLKVLKRGGRLVSSGAIAGPIVALDLRDMYLKDIALYGSTAWDEPVFPNLIQYIERGEIRPLLAKIFPLEKIAEAQEEFMQKRHIGKFVLVPKR